MAVFLLNTICILFSLFVGFISNNFFNNVLIFLKDSEFFLNKKNLVGFIIPCYFLSYSLLAFIFDFQDVFSKLIQWITIVIFICYLLIYFIRTFKKDRKLVKTQNDIESIILIWMDSLKVNINESIKYKMNIYYEGSRIRGEVTIDIPEDCNLPDEKISFLEQKLWSKKVMVYIQKKSFKLLSLN